MQAAGVRWHDYLSFPTVQDRINMAASAYAEYAESDGTSVIDFALDVLLFAIAVRFGQGASPAARQTSPPRK